APGCRGAWLSRRLPGTGHDRVRRVAGGGQRGAPGYCAHRSAGADRPRRRRCADLGDRMRILAFDTATRATAVALDEVELRDDPPAGTRPHHTTRLMPLIVEVLERAATEWAEIDRIAVGIGPGTFTGLRIGVATARSLSRARRIPLVGVSTLESLALNASGADPATARANDAHDAEAVLAVLDARRGEVFAAGWQLGHRWRP